MKRLLKDQMEIYESRQKDIEAAQDAANVMIHKYNEMVQNLPCIDEVIGTLNAHITSYNDWIDSLRDEMQCYFNDRSDRWQEGEAGEQYQEWINSFEDLEDNEVEPPEIDMVEEIYIEMPYLATSPSEV